MCSNEQRTLAKIYEDFIKFEENNNVFNLKIQGVYFWERIRFSIFKRIINFNLKQEQMMYPQPNISDYLNKIKNNLLSLVLLKRNPFFVKNKDILVIGSSRRVLKENGKWWDIYIDHFIEKMAHSYVVLENDSGGKFFVPPQTKELKYIKFIDMLTDIEKALRINRFIIKEKELQLLEKLEGKLERIYGTKANLANITISFLAKRKRYLPIYTALIKKISPKIVLVICSYGKEDLIEACKNLNIPVIELQHGVITKYHVGYSYETRNAKKIIFPDYLLTYGDFWKSTVKYPIDKKRIITVGSPEWELQKKMYQHIKKKKQILFISQKTIGKILSKFSVEVANRGKLDYKLVYKLHPSEYDNWKKNYPWLDNPNIEVVGLKGKNIYRLFAESEIQIGVFSTAIFEGLGFGLRTFLLNTFGVEYMTSLIEEKKVTLIENVDELITKLKKKEDLVKIRGEEFFKSNSISNIVQAINHIIESENKKSN